MVVVEPYCYIDLQIQIVGRPGTAMNSGVAVVECVRKLT